MFGQLNQKIMGAFLVGIALVSGAYVYTKLGITTLSQPAATSAALAPARVAIEVTDRDSNGVEDWRDSFTTTETIIATSTNYELPTTVTGMLGIQFFEDIIRAKHSGPFGKTKEEVVEHTVDTLNEQTSQELFDTHDVTIMSTWTDDDIKNYANTMANSVTTNNIEGVDQELNILYDVLNNGKTERLKELEVIVSIYENTLEDSLATPVPTLFLKQHLDLLNSYNAVKEDIKAMSIVESDPVVTLMRFKRYQDDTLALRLSLENMYLGLLPFQHLFTNTDAAVFFSNFNPSNSQPQ